ncbi:hypothetical protein QBC34DRAFT_463937 [Podospora aff. communis PSN243]|uniref:Uncharacterized protein n=1 Tax=Podospora aff. communis PSN243 TaxID=3040156 RepID=A0AAV9GND6_9PEZI|nr:hypothetical protein QBC34DRAFT_463937 [Podospora aff. communis PSN243]
MDNAYPSDRSRQAVGDGEMQGSQPPPRNQFDQAPPATQRENQFIAQSQMRNSPMSSFHGASFPSPAPANRTSTFGNFPPVTPSQAEAYRGAPGYRASFEPGGFRRSLPVASAQYDHLRGIQPVPMAVARSNPDYSVESKLKELEARLTAHEYTSNTTACRHGEQIGEILQQMDNCASASNTTARRHGEQIGELLQKMDHCTSASNMIGQLSNRVEAMAIDVHRHDEMHQSLGFPRLQEAGVPVNTALDTLKAAITRLETRADAAEKDREAGVPVNTVLDTLKAAITRFETRVEATEKDKATAAAVIAQKMDKERVIAARVSPRRSGSLPVKRPLEDSGSPEPRPSRVVKLKTGKSEGTSEDPGSSQPELGHANLVGESSQGIAHSLQSILTSIKSLDFLSMAQLTVLNRRVASSASVSFEYPIFRYEYPREATEIFYLKIGGAMANHVLPSPREDFDFDPDRCSQSDEDLSEARNSGILECVLSGKDVDLDLNDSIPEHLLPLGEIHRKRIHHPSYKGRDTNEATNFFLFLGVSHKSLWAMYRYERLTMGSHGKSTKGAQKPKTKRINFKPEDRLFKRGRLSDVFHLLEYVDEWESHKTDMLRENLQVVNVFGNERDKPTIYEPLFAVPFWGGLRRSLEDEAMQEG